MSKKILFLLAFSAYSLLSWAQQKPALTYYLPDINYDKTIPTPEAFLGYQIGEWHISHDQQLAYMRRLAELSPRVVLTEYARTYEGRPLVYLTITSEKNHKELETIKAQHRALSQPGAAAEVDISKLPVVLYQGYSIHGNEPSGGNAAPLMAYYLAAGKSREVEKMLDDMIVLLDPCYNPDGFHRFSTWANMHKNKNLTSDPQDLEYNQPSPSGRTNHYWFDLNRDWLPLQHPESRGRVAAFHEWRPNVLTDHHEMGSNSTFFFMPGEPTRVHPITPDKNQELTAKIARYHAAALDEIGSLYFSGEGYDDFYYGKGSTYPDVNGCIGILFEQASSRGHLQETSNGLLSFPFTIRNQVRTALSTYKACTEMRVELQEFQRTFYTSAIEEAQADNRKAFVFGDPFDHARVSHFVEILKQHQIKVHRLASTLTVNGRTYNPNHTYIVPLQQPQYRLIRGMFETMTTFEDSLFYDISSWTLPLAFNLSFDAVSNRDFDQSLLGMEIAEQLPVAAFDEPDYSEYAYLMEWDNYYAPKALNALLKEGLRAKVAHQELVARGRRFAPGTIMVPVRNQDKDAEAMYQLMVSISRTNRVSIYDVDSGFTPEGIDLGSGSFSSLRKPEVLLLAGSGVSAYDAGEVWHLLDQRYDMVLSMSDADRFGRLRLDRYNVIIMVDGSYSSLGTSDAEKLKAWVQQGGTLIAYKGAARWLNRQKIGSVEFRKTDEDDANSGRRAYGQLNRDQGGNVLGGAIFETTSDLSHPLLYGYRRTNLPIFRRGTLFFEPAKNPYATPLLYTNEPLLSGYINKKNSRYISNSASVVVSGTGSGRIIFMADNTNFRAFWFGTNKLLANALFFGHTIDGDAIER